MKNLLCLITLCVSFLMTGCQVAQQPKVNTSQIRSFLVVPVVNNSLEVTASDVLPTSTLYYIDEAGYYSFPPLTVKTILEYEGYYDAEKVQEESPAALAELFDADAVVFVQINKWDSTYAVFQTVTTGIATYTIYDRQGNKLFHDVYIASYSPNGRSNSLEGIIANMISSAIERADPSYEQISNFLNYSFVAKSLPEGPYLQTKTK